MAQRYEQVSENIGKILKYNFVGGVVWGLGATIGVSIVLALIGLILHQINLIPVVGSFVTGVVKFILQNDPHLLK